MSDLTPITREEALLDGADLEPITRKEQFIKRIYDKTQEVPTPITREEWFLNKAGEGGGGVTVEQLNATENGTYSEEGKAYSPVIVEVPQTTVESLNITANGTYTAPSGKAYSPVTVNVPLPTNANERKSVTSYPVTDSANYPLPKVDVTVTDADKCEVIVTTDNTITEDSGVYLNRQSGGGNRELDTIVGGSIVWNQLVGANNIRGSQTTDYVTFTKNDDGTFTMNGTASRSDWYVCAPYPNEGKTINGHVYYAFNANKNGAIDTFGIGTSGFGEAGGNITIYGNIGKVMRANGNNGALTYVYKEGVTINNEILKPILIDLTALFGTTIADYIYSLEQATAGAGVAYFRNLFPEDYYPYNAGELMSVKTSARKVYDSGINLLATYPLSNIELRGIPKLVNNQLVYDGDRYEGNGRVTRKYGIRAYQSGDESLADAITDGTNTVYKLTTPTTEQTSPYDNPQLAGSIEEFVDTREVAIPVGHESKYFNGEGYITYLDPNTSDTIDMAQEHAIMPLATTYISANGTLDVEYWK